MKPLNIENINGGSWLDFSCGGLLTVGFGLMATGFGAAGGVVLIGYASGVCLGAGLVALN